MAIKFADQKIREARQLLAALDRDLAALPPPAGDLPYNHIVMCEVRDRRAELLRERGEAVEQLQLLLFLDEMPKDDMGSA